MEEFATAAVSAMAATFLSNPLEVVKTRFQLQGELSTKGQHQIHYRNFFHAMYVIGKTDGLIGLQAGLVPALWHQVFMNGFRLSMIQIAEANGLNRTSTGEVSVPRTAALAGLAGGITAFTGSPFYMVKIQLQSQSNERIAVGTQHHHTGMFSALWKAYDRGGVKGLFRGVVGSLPRRIVGSSTQYTTFTYCKDLIATNEVKPIPKGLLNSFLASLIAGIVVTGVMNPLDTISTRLYNQGVDEKGRGLIYKGYFDCIYKMFKVEGIQGFYKGFVPLYIRTGPHTVLVFIIWDSIKDWVSSHPHLMRYGNLG
ncbi:transmembrane transporter activity [Nesidiocoris tenuis]|uniref:Transmembrane transporter activity n=1 Tax=Nesidiocoris tenuis TaxID=355587 RepID=A0ABN7A817_9HEMI|nr:transmembrane transporter activity [Nesidiocoris tenuis]